MPDSNDDLDIFERLERDHQIVIAPRDRTRPLGRGGFATVHRGVQQTQEDRACAVKIWNHPFDQEPAAVQKEREALTRLLKGPIGRLPNVVTMLEKPLMVADHDGSARLVTVWELADRSLLDLQRREFPNGLPRETALHFLEDIAHALDDIAFHEEVHRDVKPGNIMLFGNRAKLGDFGLSRLLAAHTEKTTAIRGTLEFMPPEALDNSRLDISPTFDVYSLGVTYAIVRRGRPLFSDDVASSALVDLTMITRLIMLKREFHRVDLSGLDPDEQAFLHAVCHADPKQRPMQKLVDMIRQLRGGPVVVAARIDRETGSRGAEGVAVKQPAAPRPPVLPGVAEKVLQQLDAIGRIKHDATRLIQEGRYEQAVERLDEVDSRLRDNTWALLRVQAVNAANKRDHDRARSLAAKYDYAKAVDILQNCDPKLRDETLLNDLRSRRDRVETLTADIQHAVQANEFLWHRPVVEELLGLVPDDAGLQQLRDSLQPYSERITLSCGMVLKFVRPGEFTRGDDKSSHRVRITRPFWMGIYPVTQGEWQKVMGNNPSHFKGDDRRPVENVSWNDTQGFFERLNQSEAALLKKLNLAGYRFQLPSEAMHEYVQRAGTTTRFFWGDDESRAGEFCWFDGNSNKSTQPVGQKKPNAWGFHDMAGNVWQWCDDWYDAAYYQQFAGKAAIDPRGPAAGSSRCARGGSFGSNLERTSSGCRDGVDPPGSYYHVGFRVVVSVE